MKKTIIILACSLVLAACTSKEAASPIGEPITAEQVKNLPNDDSWNNKFVSFEGYFGFCKMIGIYKAGSKADVRITTEADCTGDELINAKIGLQNSSSTVIFGAAPRNKIVSEKDIDTKTMKIITDDYQEVDYQKFLFSGNLIYNNGNYILDNVTLHLIKQ